MNKYKEHYIATNECGFVDHVGECIPEDHESTGLTYEECDEKTYNAALEGLATCLLNNFQQESRGM